MDRAVPTKIVLLHSPFVGPASMAPLVGALRELGFPVAEPIFAAAWDVEPPYYRGLARRVASTVETDHPTRLVLVAHSGAGGLLPSVAAAIGPRVQATIFVDAILPHPGRSWFDTAPPGLAARLRSRIADGRLPAWDRWFAPEVMARLLPDPTLRERFIAELKGVAAGYADELAPLCPTWPPPHCGYLQLSEGYAGEAERAAANGWLMRRDIIHHLAIATHPDKVAASLHSMIRTLADSP